ncbi:hypothetical protein K2X33_03750 [bacterium]|nr:hypothetical protein [bacterium]
MQTIPFHMPDLVSTALFCLIVAGILTAWVVAAYKAAGVEGAFVTSTATSAWLGLLTLLTVSGMLEALPMPFVPLFIGLVLVAVLGVGLSPFGRTLAAAIPIAALVGFQAFRLPLELVLHSWAEQGTIPQTMTWTGSNFDIFSGVVALIAAPFAAKHRWVAWGANLVGTALLLNVIRVVAYSSPLPFAWGVEPPLALAMHLPYSWIAPVCVGGALLGHILLTRKLLQKGAPMTKESQ